LMNNKQSVFHRMNKEQKSSQKEVY